MRSNVQRMLYSPERSSLAGTAPTGSVLPEIIFPAGVHSGKRHTLHGVKDANGSSMGRGYKSIGKLSALSLRTLSLCCSLCGLAALAPHRGARPVGRQNLGQARSGREARQDFDTAFEDYQQALLKKPKDLRYKDALRAHAISRPPSPTSIAAASFARAATSTALSPSSPAPSRSIPAIRPPSRRSNSIQQEQPARQADGPPQPQRADVPPERDPRQHRLHLRPR